MYTEEEIKQFEDEYEMVMNDYYSVMNDYYSWVGNQQKENFVGTAKPLRGKQDFDERMQGNRIRARKYWKNKHLAKHIENVLKRPMSSELRNI